MDRAEKIGLGAAVVGHVVLFGLLSVGFLATPNPEKLISKPIDVSFVDEVALESAAPQVSEAPALSQAPEQGAPEDAAPPAEAEPEPAPEPGPQPAPPQPAPAPRPEPAPQPKAEPKPAPRPAPKAPPRPAPRPAPKAEPKPAPKPAPKAAPKAPAQPSRSAPASKAKAPPAKAKGTGGDAEAKAARPRGSRLGSDFLKGIADTPSPGKAQTPRAANVGARSLAGISDAIARQIQPCANRITNPGPGANQIRSRIRLQMARDGTLAARPQLRGQTGVDGDNERYAQRVGELAIAAIIQCAPYELPDDLYEGGWQDIIINYRLP